MFSFQFFRFLGGYRQNQHPLSSLLRVCGTCSLAPAHTERLQGRAGCRGAGLGSGSTGGKRRGAREAAPGRESFRQQRWAGEEGTAQGNPVVGEISAPPSHPRSADTFLEQPSPALGPHGRGFSGGSHLSVQQSSRRGEGHPFCHVPISGDQQSGRGQLSCLLTVREVACTAG